MTKTSALKTVSAADFEARMATYKPKGLPPEQWEAWADDVADMARSAEPSSVQDLTYLLGSICAFLSWSTPIHGDDDLPAQVTPDQITRFLAVLANSGASVGTRENRRSQLFRVQRGLAGLSARKAIKRGRSPFAKPYSPGSVSALRETSAPSANLTRLLGLLDNHSISSQDVVAALEGTTTDSLRAEFAAVGLTFDRLRWRSTWTSCLVSTGVDFATLARRHGFSRNDCERYLQHHEETVGTRDQLRG